MVDDEERICRTGLSSIFTPHSSLFHGQLQVLKDIPTKTPGFVKSPKEAPI